MSDAETANTSLHPPPPNSKKKKKKKKGFQEQYIEH